MAKTVTKRKSPAKRKPAAKTNSALALSGWIVAAGLGAAWGGPQLGLWPRDVLDKIPSFEDVRTMASRGDEAPRKEPLPKQDAEPERRRATARVEETRPSDAAPQKAVLPPIKSETIADIVRKAEAKPGTPLPKSPPRMVSAAPATPALLPPPAVPAAIPFVTAAIRNDQPERAATGRPGELAIRRYPFTTAPAIAFVGDLRTLRILGGEGDWKKVEISSSGAIGWLRLQRLGEKP